MTVGLLLLPAFPLVLAVCLWRAGTLRRSAVALAPWAAVPAGIAALLPGAGDALFVDWLLLGAWVGLDVTGRLFLLFTAVLWTVAGLHATSYVNRDRHRYFCFHLLTLSGNLGLIVSQDLASFYLFFALMTFSAYGLVVHDGTPEAYAAGRVYIVMAVIGETLLLIAFLIAAAAAPSLALADIRAAAADSPATHLLIALFLAGFGIKAGAVPLHMWLPLAHPVAPTPASAVLSGCMIKAGLLGWLRFLPLGEAASPGWGGFVIALGLGAAIFGVLIGVTQRNPKTVLAYSSVSQMGIMNVAVGIGLSDPDAWLFALPAIPLYALHHGLAKGALFLGVSVADHGRSRTWARRLVLAGLAIPALSLAGAPLTTGAFAKIALKDAAAVAPGAWASWLDVLLPMTAVGTTVLMARFLWVVTAGAGRQRPAPLRLAWGLAVAASILVFWVVPPHVGVDVDAVTLLRPYDLWTAAWPLWLGAVLALVTARTLRSRREWNAEIAPGDLLVAFRAVWTRVRRRPIGEVPVADIPAPPDPVASVASSWYGLFAESTPGDRLARIERRLVSWEYAATVMLVLIGVLWLATR